MRCFVLFLTCCLALQIAGCAIHPIPNDVTGLSTARIVRKIRCEAREAVRRKLVAFLRFQRDNAQAQRIADELDAPSAEIAKIDYHAVDPGIRRYIDKYEATAIAYNFSFDMTEVNNLDLTTDSLRPFSYGAGMLGINAGLGRTRQNIRNFTVADSFSELLRKVEERYCQDKNTEKNYIYPIVGNIGVDEMIETFIDLSEFGNLSGGEKDPKGPPTIADTISFTTKLSGSVTPKITLMPTQPRLALNDASLGAVASRQDIHRVIVALSLPAKDTNTKGVTRFDGQLVSVNGGEAKQLAALAIQQQIIRYELTRTVPIVVGNSILPFF